MALASLGCSCRNSSKRAPNVCSTTGLTSDETSFSLVCEEKLGSGTLTLSTAIMPSRMSSPDRLRSEEHTSELQSLMRISYAVFCLKKKNTTHQSPSHLTLLNITMHL